MISITLTYTGKSADNSVIEMYDAARGLAGLQRSLALTTHLILNGEIITQAPALKGAQILSSTPEPGSWKITAVIISGVFTVGTASQDTPIGHLIYSAYDYIINASLGFHVDYKKSLGQQYEEQLHAKKITAEKLDSLMEKTESSLADIHRPIVASETARQAEITAIIGRSLPKRVGPTMTSLTFDYLAKTKIAGEMDLDGAISSFNINTMKGRIFSIEDQRPIPFELGEGAKDARSLLLITTSLRTNASRRSANDAAIRMHVKRFETPSGRLKALIVTHVSG